MTSERKNVCIAIALQLQIAYTQSRGQGLSSLMNKIGPLEIPDFNIFISNFTKKNQIYIITHIVFSKYLNNALHRNFINILATSLNV